MLTKHDTVVHGLKAPSLLVVDEEENILVLSTPGHRLHKFLAINNYDSVISIGGNTIGAEALANPVQIEAPNRQTVFLLDAGNRRLMLLNPNLRVIRTYDFLTQEISLPDQEPLMLNPSAFTLTPLSELFLLNQDDNRIHKLDHNGKLELMFGGPDFGEGSTLAANGLASNPGPYIFVPEPQLNRVQVFDNFGTFRHSLTAPEGFAWQRFRVFGDFALFIGPQAVCLLNLRSRRAEQIMFQGVPNIVDVAMRPRRLYVLTPHSVILYPTLHHTQRP